MKLSQLSFFCAVVEHGTIAAAAEQLHCVPSNITIRIRELERLLGTKLFSRERNRLYVTPEGRLLYTKAKVLLSQALEIQHLFEGSARAGMLNVGALEGVLNYQLPPFIARYRSMMPNIELNLHSGHTFSLERMLTDGELDLIISDGPIEHPLLSSSLAFRESLRLITPQDVMAPSAKNISALEFYVFGKECNYRQVVDNWLAGLGIAPRAILEIESYPVMFACVAQGHGMACVPESSLSMYREAYSVNSHRLDNVGAVDTYFIWRKYQVSRLTTDFIDIVSGTYSGEPK
ncbi:LysR family transcriptional regulator [Pseudomonas chlororaphis]|uniref:LysR family transcriptional regulator n=1 Tax=Pseudomonas chlororaphis TaxID=587753 RepID=A0A1Q8EMA6_9PSED|nr:LysR family transcriptional regulator [Pseudomonas chlororaphis]OLF52933.1 LysR family transcriptional regulator [Pseudomonas chlororaphis]